MIFNFFIISIFAHSWLHCTKYEGNLETFEPDKCLGIPRPMSSGGNVRTFGADVGMDFRPQAGSQRCQGNGALGVAANYPSGLVTYEAGQTYTLAWPPKNHAAATCTNQYIPDTFLRLYMAPYDQAAGDPTQEVFRENQLTASFSDDPHVRNTIDFKGFQNCPRFCDDTDKSLCTGTFQVPENAAPGIYTFQWYWAFNNEGDLYATCYEAEILPKNTNPGTPTTTSASSPGSPSTTPPETTQNPSSVYVNLDFQTTPVGFTTGQTVRVESQALRFETSTANFNNGFLRSTSSIPGEHWGRLWIKMDAVSLSSNLGHWVVVAGGVGNQQIRMVDINSNEAGRVVFQLGWQDDQYQKVTSWANKYPLSTSWVCYEWNMNPTAQTFDFYVNGQAVAWDSPTGIGSNVPAGRSLPTTLDWVGFGAENFGGSGGTPIAGFLDNILVSASRAGCGASPDTATGANPVSTTDTIDTCVGCCVRSEFLAPGTGAMIPYGLIRNSETVILPCPYGFTGEFDLMCVNSVAIHSDGYCTPGSASSISSDTDESKNQTGTVVGLALALTFVSIAFALYVAFDRGFLKLEDVKFSPKASSAPKLKRDPEDVKTVSSGNLGTKTPEIDWHYVQDGRSVGPVKESTLIAHLKSLPQDLALGTQVWNGTTVLEWRQVSEVASLARSLRTMWIPK